MRQNPAQVREVEECSLRAWPCLEEKILDGWILRFSDGYTRRANSVQAMDRGKLPFLDKVKSCESAYVERGLPTIFKVTPLAEEFGLDLFLDQRGYVRQAETSVQALDLGEGRMPDPDLQMEQGWSPAWQSRFAAWSGLPEERHPLLMKILNRMKGKALFGTLSSGGRPVACASGVLDGRWLGLYEVVTAPEVRRKGLAKKLVEGLLGWALAQGASIAYLQVMDSNVPALALYRSVGFEEAYRYHYRVRT